MPGRVSEKRSPATPSGPWQDEISKRGPTQLGIGRGRLHGLAKNPSHGREG